jgi:DNA-binding response OmpR family regulator
MPQVLAHRRRLPSGAGEDEKVGGLLDGADDYLPKPFSSKELIARCHLQMQMGKKRIDLERRFAARTLELHVRAVEAEEKRREAEEQRRQQEVSLNTRFHRTGRRVLRG